MAPRRRKLTTRADISLQVLIVNIAFAVVIGVILGCVGGAVWGLFTHKVIETIGEGLIVGAVLGAVAGLLLALHGPQSHSDAPLLVDDEDTPES